MAKTRSIAFLMFLLLFASGCGLAERATRQVARLMTCHLFAIGNEAVLTQSTFHKHDVVAPRIEKKKTANRASHEQKPAPITGPIQLASLRLPLATAGVRNESAVLCIARDRLQQPRERVFRYVIVTGSASQVSVGG